MESIAETAQASKVTLYKYFPDKEAAFEGVASRLAEQLLAAVVLELEADASAPKAVSNALSVKHSIVWSVVRNSSYATELFSTKSKIAQRTFSNLDRMIIDLIAKRLAYLGSRESRETAKIVFWAVNGVANASESEQELNRNVDTVVHALIERTSEI